MHITSPHVRLRAKLYNQHPPLVRARVDLQNAVFLNQRVRTESSAANLVIARDRLAAAAGEARRLVGYGV